MQPNLQAWMDQYAARFRQPNLASSSPAPGMAPQQNLVAAAPPPAGQVTGNMAPAAASQAAPTAAPENGTTGEDDSYSFERMFLGQPEHIQDEQVSQLEKQVGDINKAYDKMQSDLGQRPDTKLSRREKGMLIMEFGLQLLSQSSGSRHGGDFGGAVGDAGIETMQSYRGLKDRKRGEQQQFDTVTRNLTAGRVKDVAAAREQGVRDMREERSVRAAELRATNDQRRLDQGEERISNLEKWRDTQVTHGIGAGRPAGGGGRGNTTANIQNIKDLVDRGVPEDLAVRLVYRQISDPKKAWQALYTDRRKSYSSEQEARDETDRIIGLLYGADSVEGARQPIVPAKKPSANPVTIKTDQDYADLASGQVFIGPDGVKRRKP